MFIFSFWKMISNTWQKFCLSLQLPLFISKRFLYKVRLLLKMACGINKGYFPLCLPHISYSQFSHLPYVLLWLNVGCYEVRYEKQICSQLLVCSLCRISLHYYKVKKVFHRRDSNAGDRGKQPNYILKIIIYHHTQPRNFTS